MKKIYNTHGAGFHTDDVLGYVITKRAGITRTYIRTNDLFHNPQQYITADKGGVYNPQNGQFDHHQINWDNPQPELVRDTGVPYATSGLLWKEYGMHIVSGTTGEIAMKVALIDKWFIQVVDALDASKNLTWSCVCEGVDIPLISLSNVISMYNDVPMGFEAAAEILDNVLTMYKRKADKYVELYKNIDSVGSLELNGSLLILREGISWVELVHDMFPYVLMVAYPADRNPYNLQMVAQSPTTREFRHKNGIIRPEGFTNFIHATGFLAACDSVEQVMLVAKKTLGL